MKSRIIAIVVLLILVVQLSACSLSADKEKYESCFTNLSEDSHVVLILDDSTFYFTDHTLRLRDITGDEAPNGGYLFANGKLYFSTAKKNGLNNYSLYIYCCDLYGNNKTLLWEKHDLTTSPWATGKDGVMYFQYRNTSLVASSQVITSYDISTGECRTEGAGKSYSLSNYRKDSSGKYNWEMDDEILTIVDPQENVTYTLDTVAMLEKSFGSRLDGLKYSFCRLFATADGRIFLLYKFNSNTMDYPHFVCEYIPSQNEVVFKLLCFAYDIESFELEYLDNSY